MLLLLLLGEEKAREDIVCEVRDERKDWRNVGLDVV